MAATSIPLPTVLFSFLARRVSKSIPSLSPAWIEHPNRSASQYTATILPSSAIRLFSDVIEDTPNSAAVTLSVAGSISVTDSDPGQATFQTPTISAPGNLGNLVLASDGAYTY